ncbi:unnamed protein product [Kuraishia capsulata CBS 1993]|uniref:Protein FRG1 n=1 Tax=Kuraishia capsulata CBS 1993 TaxID=1382522 RepID=W6MM87_9ASCO|nr:uncharacterized protein KUCA_T00003625001 [Kuraishia capsulata CBS 1993]CDK27646.1 unnamed protein product [Kuraishia capsulata CBS 1993]
MVSKLSFKNDKKRKRESHKSSHKKRKPEQTEGPQHFVHINNSYVDLKELDPELLETGWTTSVNSVDIKGPIILCSDKGVLAVKDSELVVMSSLEPVGVEHSINFTSDDLVIEGEIYRGEPNSASQVFVPVPVKHLLSATSGFKQLLQQEEKSTEMTCGLKTYENKYVSYLPDSGTLTCDSEALTAEGIFTFRPVRADDGPRWEVFVGSNSAAIGVFGDSVKISKSPEQFVVRMQVLNHTMSAGLREHLAASKTDHRPTNELQLEQKVKELIHDGVKVTNATLKQLKNAIAAGNVNEVMVEIKQKRLSDARC